MTILTPCISSTNYVTLTSYVNVEVGSSNAEQGGGCKISVHRNPRIPPPPW